jgi:hypothetical protein
LEEIDQEAAARRGAIQALFAEGTTATESAEEETPRKGNGPRGKAK